MSQIRPRIRGLTGCRPTLTGWLGELNGVQVRIEYRLPFSRCWPARVNNHVGLILQSRSGLVYLAKQLEDSRETTASSSSSAWSKAPAWSGFAVFAASLVLLTVVLFNQKIEPQSPPDNLNTKSSSGIDCSSQETRNAVAEKLWNGENFEAAKLQPTGSLEIGGMRKGEYQFACAGFTESIAIYSLRKDGIWKFSKITRSKPDAN
ncbi:MAG: hypothetical protein ACKOWH_00215 [Rhodoluna sp.]